MQTITKRAILTTNITSVACGASWQIVYIFIEFLMSFANLQIVLIGRIQQCISPVPIASGHLSSVRSFIAQKPVSSAALCK
ncbi:hypothetical protein T09_13981 [Trichinella sp. T9]|nr:hypothetical protein T09_13981 [Trichinella sp. T9]